VVLLAVPFFFLNSNLKDPSATNALDRLLLSASAPVQHVATRLAMGVSLIIENYVYLVDVKEEHDRLAAEAGRLRQENATLQRHQAENQRLRRLLALRERLGREAIAAEVISKEMSQFFRVIRVRVDRGETEGIETGMPVVSADGLVGQIQRAVGGYADVRLIVDPQSSVDIVVQRTGASGALRGIGASNRYLCQVHHLERTDRVDVGDEVYTSGLGHRFPAAILVGRVSKVLRQDFGLYQEVEVEPAVDFSRLSEVMILTEGSRQQELRRAETGGEP
jgi:rod shape-determining protein MreC